MSRFNIKHLTTIISVWFIVITLPLQAETLFSTTLIEKLKTLEVLSDGRLGVCAVNTADNKRLEYRGNERFPLCSTAKFMCVAAILKRTMENNQFLQQRVIYTSKDLVAYSPMTKDHLLEGSTLSELCEAALTLSDNTAMNLLLKKLGGPLAVTTFARTIGDNKFRLDRFEPALNSSIPGDQRDTTTPFAMEKSLNHLVLGKGLALSQQDQLKFWLKNNTTGGSRIQAGVPKGWVVADKTGTGEYGTTNDVGIIWPPRSKPIVIAIYFTQNKKNAAPRDEIIASITRLLIDSFKEV